MNLETLNPPQREAVCQMQGPLLILAGAGSGKTRVITTRIAYLLQQCQVAPWSILAITFTNKAAKEMKVRVEQLCADKAQEVWISTFHSFCLRVLRKDIERLGYDRNFVIYDTADQHYVLKEAIREARLRDDSYKPSAVASYLSEAKDQMLSPEQYQKKYAGDFRLSKIASIYQIYQKRLKANNALDFDDLIYLTVRLFQENEDVADFYRRKFQYVMVDEYQDTNYSQYLLIRALTSFHRNLCVVGDDDQSIYGWRGARISNILDFEKDFPDAQVIKLEQNYRSTQNILGGANSVIQNNPSRKSKALWTESGEGDKIRLLRSADENTEALMVASEMKRLVQEEGRSLSELAILYRTNAQSRALEEALMKSEIPYKIFGSLKFYERKEIKDLMAYLRLIYNSADDVAFMRALNVPKRGIGARTAEKISEAAARDSLSCLKIASDPTRIEASSRTHQGILKFALLVHSFQEMAQVLPLLDLYDKVLENTGYLRALAQEQSDEASSRIENLQELRSVLGEFNELSPPEGLEAFLGSVTLMTDLDQYEEEENYVSLMTLHSAKGLEFPVVFMTGMEEGLFPTSRAILESPDTEEERRLCYVGMTRARERLYLTYALERQLYGKRAYTQVSRFIREINSELLDEPGRKAVEKPKNLYERYQQKYHSAAPAPQTGQSDIRVGSRVAHKMFGEGMVVAKTGTVYTVAFAGKGIKQIDTSFVHMKVLE